LGRLLLEYWWPGEWDPAKAAVTSPYVDAILEMAPAHATS
jgi:hypothetical protein